MDMKKGLSLLLTAALLLGAAGCTKSTSAAQEPTEDTKETAAAETEQPSETEQPTEAAPTETEAASETEEASETEAAAETKLPGGWIRPASPVVTEALQTLLEKALKDYDGPDCIPDAYLSYQVVAGRNHALLCRLRPAGSSSRETWGIVYVYEDPDHNAKIMEVRDFGVPTRLEYDEPVSGGWGLPSSPELSAEERALFTRALRGYLGVDYVPVAKLSMQVVAGFVKCYVCEATPVYSDAVTSYVLIEIFEDLDGGATVTSIDTLPGETDTMALTPNPFVDYDSLEEAIEDVGFELIVPEQVTGYAEREVQVVNREMLQITYRTGENRLLVRKAWGEEDISGDYNSYSEIDMTEVGDYLVELRGENRLVHVARWYYDGYTYAIVCSEPMERAELEKLIAQIR